RVIPVSAAGRRKSQWSLIWVCLSDGQQPGGALLRRFVLIDLACDERGGLSVESSYDQDNRSIGGGGGYRDRFERGPGAAQANNHAVCAEQGGRCCPDPRQDPQPSRKLHVKHHESICPASCPVTIANCAARPGIRGAGAALHGT